MTEKTTGPVELPVGAGGRYEGQLSFVPCVKVYFEQIFSGDAEGKLQPAGGNTCPKEDAEWRGLKVVISTLGLRLNFTGSWILESELHRPWSKAAYCTQLPSLGHCETRVWSHLHQRTSGQGGAEDRTGHTADVSAQKAAGAHTDRLMQTPFPGRPVSFMSPLKATCRTLGDKGG